MTAEEFDEMFDRGEDVTAALDLSTARRPGQEQHRDRAQARDPVTDKD